MDDYSAEATELVETYGSFLLSRLAFSKSSLRLPHEVHHHWYVPIVCLSASFLKFP